ncbi:MAG: hypothetical protein C4523_09480 [Myxococcales bacterium]|nr:MAG: hypothetical protein C4523_09480 [Myxococcales bacterium]
MTVPIRPDLTGRGIHDEEAQADRPLGAHAPIEMLAMCNALYEHLTDEEAPGADAQTIDGHRHARPADGEDADSAYVQRDLFITEPGYIVRQNTMTVMGAVYWVALVNFFDNSAAALEPVYALRACFYSTWDVDNFYFRLLAWGDGATTGDVTATIYEEGDDPETVLLACALTGAAGIEAADTEAAPKLLEFSFAVDRTDDKWDQKRLRLGIEFTRTAGAGPLYAESADRHQPVYYDAGGSDRDAGSLRGGA